MSNRSRNPCVLLRSNVRFLNTTRRGGRPSSRVRGTTVAVIEYSSSSSLLNRYGSSSSTGVSGTACDLVRVTDVSGRVAGKFPHALRQALLGAASARTNEKMAREFFETLKRVGSVALVEVDAPKRVASPSAPAQEPMPVVAPTTEPEVDPMDALRAEMAEQDDWDAETDEERVAREQTEQEERTEQIQAQRESVLAETAEHSAATRLAALWRGHVGRASVADLNAMIAQAEAPTREEEDDAAQILEWQEASGVQGECAQDTGEYGMEEYSDYPFEEDEPWGDGDSHEREWEEHRAEERLERWRR